MSLPSWSTMGLSAVTFTFAGPRLSSSSACPIRLAGPRHGGRTRGNFAAKLSPGESHASEQAVELEPDEWSKFVAALRVHHRQEPLPERILSDDSQRRRQGQNLGDAESNQLKFDQLESNRLDTNHLPHPPTHSHSHSPPNDQPHLHSQDSTHEHPHTHHHTHSHEHPQPHSSTHSHTHTHEHPHEHPHTHSHTHSSENPQPHSHSHSHTHTNEHPHEHSHAHSHEHPPRHSHEHPHTHSHTHSHTPPHEHPHAQPHGHSHKHPHEQPHTDPHGHSQAHPHGRSQAHPHEHPQTHSHEQPHAHSHTLAHEHSNDSSQAHSHHHPHEHPHTHSHEHPHAHSHEHPHTDPHEHPHTHSHEHPHAHSHEHPHTDPHEHPHTDPHEHPHTHSHTPSHEHLNDSSEAHSHHHPYEDTHSHSPLHSHAHSHELSHTHPAPPPPPASTAHSGHAPVPSRRPLVQVVGQWRPRGRELGPNAGEGKILFVDAQTAGVAGDMCVAALLDLGVPVEALSSGLAGLGLDGFQCEVHGTERSAICAPRFVVNEIGPQPFRDYAIIRRVLQHQSSIPKGAAQIALRAFNLLAQAEASIHGMPLDSVHFHEVGAIDSIVDIVACSVALDYLGLRLQDKDGTSPASQQSMSVAVSPLPMGRGIIRGAAHGPLPCPAPATLDILCRCGIPTFNASLIGELVTPTGACLLGAIHSSVTPWPSMVPERAAYGSGTKAWADRPNLLRMVLGTPTL